MLQVPTPALAPAPARTPASGSSAARLLPTCSRLRPIRPIGRMSGCAGRGGAHGLRAGAARRPAPPFRRCCRRACHSAEGRGLLSLLLLPRLPLPVGRVCHCRWDPRCHYPPRTRWDPQGACGRAPRCIFGAPARCSEAGVWPGPGSRDRARAAGGVGCVDEWGALGLGRASRERPTLHPGTLWGKPSPEAGTTSRPVQRGKVLGAGPLWLGGRPSRSEARGLERLRSRSWGLGFEWEQVWVKTLRREISGHQALEYRFVGRASAWPQEIQLDPEDMDSFSFSSQLIKREVSSPHEFTLQ